MLHVVDRSEEEELQREFQRAKVAEYELRFAVLTQPSGRVEMRYFASPRHEGETIHLTARERDDLVEALSVPGRSFIARDDAASAQMQFVFMRTPNTKEVAA